MKRTVLPFRTQANRRASIGPATAHLAAGGLLAHPTETVYGIGCALRESALARLARLKVRQGPFLVLVDAAPVATTVWSADAALLAKVFWPGPLTIVVQAHKTAFPPAVLGPLGTIAVRATSHPGMRAMLGAFGEPVTSTSANQPGGTPAMSATEVLELLAHIDPEGAVWVLDGGELVQSSPSTLVDCTTHPPRVLRAGATGIDALREVIHGVQQA